MVRGTRITQGVLACFSLSSSVHISHSYHFLGLISTHLFVRNASTTMSYSKELRIASLAVQRASILTKEVFHKKVKGTELKGDKSPVTVGDYGAQALIIQAIKYNFPQDEIVGEEDSSDLRNNPGLTEQIWNLVKDVKLGSGETESEAEKELGGRIQSSEQMLQAIDAGSSAGGSKGRIWALDPIDGTKGFLRGGQYAVCLALIEDGEVKVGVLGCPNLPVDDSAPLSADVTDSGEEQHQRGVLFAAIYGQGATSQPLGDDGLLPHQSIHMRTLPLKEATFCESVEAGHSSHGDQAEIAKKLGITNPSVRMDSQAKYGSIARGAGDLYLRLPVSATYEEKIWDHAAGVLIVGEAGGIVTDALGNKVDFGQGRTLKKNKGIVAAPKSLHAEVIDAVKSVLSAKL
jgi:3'(2'), 5'-bisphosphate nucleotidase